MEPLGSSLCSSFATHPTIFNFHMITHHTTDLRDTWPLCRPIQCRWCTGQNERPYIYGQGLDQMVPNSWTNRTQSTVSRHHMVTTQPMLRELDKSTPPDDSLPMNLLRLVSTLQFYVHVGQPRSGCFNIPHNFLGRQVGVPEVVKDCSTPRSPELQDSVRLRRETSRPYQYEMLYMFWMLATTRSQVSGTGD